jgi:putative ABC transport system permease protein
MSYSDYSALNQNLQNAAAVNFKAEKFGETLKAGKMEVPGISIKGITYDYAQIQNLNFEYGRYFSPIEVENGRPVCVIGYGLAQDLFGNVNPVGREVRLQGRRFEVAGMIAYQGGGIFGGTSDDDFLIPYAKFTQIYNPNADRLDKVVTVKAENRKVLPQVEQQAVGLIRQARGLKPGMENNFSINKQESLLERLDRVFNVLEIGGTFISIFSLLVGGFGIANIMFVAVKERTQEIGMQMAIGARRNFILMEFLVEAVLLCLVGAATGIVLLTGISFAAEFIIGKVGVEMEIITSFSTIMLGVGFAVLTGLISGLLPAWQASRLQPVEAIRAGG